MFENRRWASVHTAVAERFAPGEQVANPRRGDFILTHGKSWTSRMIRFGETIRYWGDDKKFTHWNHAAIFVSENGDIVEALGAGVQQRNIAVYKGTEYHVARCLERTGEIFPTDPWRIMPADPAKYFNVQPSDLKADIGTIPDADSGVQARSK